MERSEKKRNVEMLKRQQQDEKKDFPAVSLERETERLEGPHVSYTEDEEEQGSTPLITACRKGMTEVRTCMFGSLAAIVLYSWLSFGHLLSVLHSTSDTSPLFTGEHVCQRLSCCRLHFSFQKQ